MDNSDLRAAALDAIRDLDNIRRRFTIMLNEIDGEAVQVPRQGRWTKPMLEDLWSAVSHLVGCRVLFRVTADSAPTPVTFAEVTHESHLSEQQQRNAHARLGRVSTSLFGEKKWPIENWQGPPGPDGKAEMVYRMDQTIAAWWTEISGWGVTRGGGPFGRP